MHMCVRGQGVMYKCRHLQVLVMFFPNSSILLFNMYMYTYMTIPTNHNSLGCEQSSRPSCMHACTSPGKMGVHGSFATLKDVSVAAYITCIIFVQTQFHTRMYIVNLLPYTTSLGVSCVTLECTLCVCFLQ